MEFKNKVFRWDNKGVEPSETLKTEGFKGGYRPPAEVFNKFWSAVSDAIAELQTAVNTNVSEKIEATGTGSLLQVTTDEEITDGGQLSVKLPADLEDNAKITINNGSQIPIKNPDGTPVKGGQKAGTYLNIIYSEPENCFYLVGGGSSGLSLGETSETAYRGDRGKTAYDHSQIVTGNPHNTKAADITYSEDTSVKDALDSLNGAFGKFVAMTTTFNADGSITEVSGTQKKVTTFDSDTQITERLFDNEVLQATKVTTFNGDTISEVVS